MFKISFEDAGIIGIIGGIAAAGWAFFQTKRMKDAANKLNMSIEDVAKRTPVEIQKAFLDATAEKAINHKVDSWSKAAAVTLKDQIHKDMDTKIHADVDAAYNDLHSKVSDKIDAEVAKINIDSSEIAKEVKEKVGQMIFKEFISSSGLGKMFGGNDKADSMEGLQKILESLPIYERSDFLENYFSKH